VLGDEINRASPKTQSALLEAMEEQQVTVDNRTYKLPAPFIVIATQNPIEHAGTYPLPESELDRFLMRIHMGYPDRESELEILDTHGARDPVARLEPVASGWDVLEMMAVARSVFVAPGLKGYLVDLAEATRSHPGVGMGMSPRATLHLLRAARARAAAEGRSYLLPDDVKALAHPVLDHRLSVALEGQAPGAASEALSEILERLPVPRTARE
ncbi:MAG TPA: MoxR family ATPase, partial [Acidimicrobiales bacterium]|nr:MoxR family ATPase [Acidimicrobiales bacterium]